MYPSSTLGFEGTELGLCPKKRRAQKSYWRRRMLPSVLLLLLDLLPLPLPPEVLDLDLLPLPLLLEELLVRNCLN